MVESGIELRSVTNLYTLLSSTLPDAYRGDSNANRILTHTIEWGEGTGRDMGSISVTSSVRNTWRTDLLERDAYCQKKDGR